MSAAAAGAAVSGLRCRARRGERGAGGDAGADDEAAATGAGACGVRSVGLRGWKGEDFMTTTPDDTSLGDVLRR